MYENRYFDIEIEQVLNWTSKCKKNNIKKIVLRC